MHLIPRTCLHFVDYRNCHRKLTVSNINFKADKSCLGWFLNWKKAKQNIHIYLPKTNMEKQKMVEIPDYLDSIKFSSNGHHFQKLGKISNIAKMTTL